MFERNKWQTCIQQEGSKETVKKYMEKKINKENAWDQKTEIGIVEEVSIKEIKSAIKKMKLGKASGLFQVSMEMINASGKVRIYVMIKLCQRVFDGKKCLKIED